jgi:penicillin-binding protein 1A
MENPFSTGEDGEKRRPVKKSSFLLEIDAWIDSTLYESRFAAGEFWEEVVIFFRRFRARGLKRFFVEDPERRARRSAPAASSSC